MLYWNIKAKTLAKAFILQATFWNEVILKHSLKQNFISFSTYRSSYKYLSLAFPCIPNGSLHVYWLPIRITCKRHIFRWIFNKLYLIKFSLNHISFILMVITVVIRFFIPHVVLCTTRSEYVLGMSLAQLRKALQNKQLR